MDRWSGILRVPLCPNSRTYYKVGVSLCISHTSKILSVPTANAIFFCGDQVGGTGNPVIKKLSDLQNISEILVSKFSNSINAWVIQASVFRGPFAVYDDFIPSVNEWGEPASYNSAGFPASTSTVSLLSSCLEEVSSKLSFSLYFEWIEENPINTVIEKPHRISALDPVNFTQGNDPSQGHLKNQVSGRTSSNSVEPEECYISLRKIDDGCTKENSDACIKVDSCESIEQSATKCTNCVLEPSEASFCKSFYDIDESCHMILAAAKESTPTPQMSELMCPSGKEESESSLISQCFDDVDEDASDSVAGVLPGNSDPSTGVHTSQMLELICPSKKEQTDPSHVTSCFNDVGENSNSVALVLPENSVQSAEFQSSQQLGTICDYLANKTESAFDESDTLASEKSLQTVSFAGSMTETEPLCSDSSSFACCLSSNDSASFSSLAISCRKGSLGVVGCISGSSEVLASSAQAPLVTDEVMASFDTFHSVESSDSCGGNSVESRMENVDLHDKVKLEESCVVVDDRELYAVSSRVRKLRSYKKRIQDAFASKKRLAKEYEQLAIWFGDANLDSTQDNSQVCLPLMFKSSLEANKQQVPNVYDSEWELI